MKKSKKTLMCCLCALLACGAIVGTTCLTNGPTFRAYGVDNAGVWNHYLKTQGDEITIGNSEYWIQCGTNTVVFEEPVGEKVEMSKGADTSAYSIHDERYTDDPLEYVFSPEHLLGVSLYDILSKDDKTWAMKGNVTEKTLPYKTYSGVVLKSTLPYVNFRYYDEVSMNLKSTIWNEGFKFGFTEDVVDTGISVPVGANKDGGTVKLIRVAEDTVRMIVNHPNGGLETFHDFVGEDYVNGKERLYFYTKSGGDVVLEMSNWTTVCYHEHHIDEFESLDYIGAVKTLCTDCLVETEDRTAPELSFDIVNYGATAYRNSDHDDWCSHTMVITADKISYKSYDQNWTMAMVLPRIKFADFSKVDIGVGATNWTELIGFGFTAEEAETRENHTKWGGEKTGNLVFEWSEDALNVTFTFEYLTMETVVTDTDIINGLKGFTLFQTCLYDRFLDFSNFNLTIAK